MLRMLQVVVGMMVYELALWRELRPWVTSVKPNAFEQNGKGQEVRVKREEAHAPIGALGKERCSTLC